MTTQEPITAFQRRVYERVKEIPPGRVTTYAALARAVGCASPQAIGQALRRNPFAPRVPCHRVIRSDRSIGGFNGQEGGAETSRKEALLLAEGVDIRGGRLHDAHTFFDYQQEAG
jgi:methylated-DNA-[protein]-cysteine S-methyltransferase